MKKVIILIVLITIAITIEFSSVSCQGEGGMSLAETEKLKQDSSSNASESMTSEILKPPEGWPLPFNEGIFINSSDTRIKGQCGFRIWEITETYPGPTKEIYNWYKANFKG